MSALIWFLRAVALVLRVFRKDGGGVGAEMNDSEPRDSVDGERVEKRGNVYPLW